VHYPLAVETISIDNSSARWKSKEYKKTVQIPPRRSHNTSESFSEVLGYEHFYNVCTKSHMLGFLFQQAKLILRWSFVGSQWYEIQFHMKFLLCYIFHVNMD
jgi:hypothetical protein